MRTNGSTMPLLFSTADCALRILDAATIFMAFVILPMFLIALMRCLTAQCNPTARCGQQATRTYVIKQASLKTTMMWAVHVLPTAQCSSKLG